MSDVWTARAQAYRVSDAHAQGEDLDQLVAWAAGARTALDVATGGGHVARRLRDAGLDVVTSDPSPGMQPEVICHAEDLPFATARSTSSPVARRSIISPMCRAPCARWHA